MPKPVRGGQRYIPGLDGVRALAVLAVVAYHLDLSWAGGGLLGVGVFFTLSGYLITDLLLGQWETHGRLLLADFWLRRARRLLPALFVMLAVVAAWITVLDRSQLPAIRGDVGAAAVYVSNWWLIAQHNSYFARFGPPSPLGHLWSLAVEEQFYLIWPWLLWLGLRWQRGRPRADEAGSSDPAARRRLRGGHGRALPARVRPDAGLRRHRHPGVCGADRRGAGLRLAQRHLGSDVSKTGRRILDGMGAAGLAIVVVLIWRTSEYTAFLYRGGMVLLSAGTAAMVASAASPASRFGRVLGNRPLRWIGVRSYGIYLWHFPIIVMTTPASGRDSLARGAFQVAAAIGAAALSWRFIEEPVRRGAVGRWWARIRSTGWHPADARRGVKLTVAGAVAVVGLASCGLAGVVRPPLTPVAGTRSSPSHAAAAASASGAPGSRAPSAAATSPSPAAAGGPPRTACRAVVHIGDSTSEGLISPSYLPMPQQRIAAQYAQVGVTQFIPEISGARSIVETYENQPNAYTVAQQLLRGGYRGCWVLALGTNDTADVAVGSPVGLKARISEMMALIGNQPVMWVNVRSLLAAGAYSETNMQQWNSDLIQACARYPNMRVYDWASVVQSSWFISDGIHYTSPGYAARAQGIASALAAAFPQNTTAGSTRAARSGSPASGKSPACLVR